MRNVTPSLETSSKSPLVHLGCCVGRVFDMPIRGGEGCGVGVSAGSELDVLWKIEKYSMPLLATEVTM